MPKFPNPVPHAAGIAAYFRARSARFLSIPASESLTRGNGFFSNPFFGGSEANASCNCGLSYVPKKLRAAEAIKANPEKSDRAIAADLGVDPMTVNKARRELGVEHSTPERIGRDGKSYTVAKPGAAPRRGKDAVRERVLEAMAASGESW